MKKTSIIIFTLILTVSSYSQKLLFEKTLGKDNVQALNSLIEVFEKETLKNKYPDLNVEKAYKEFLIDVSKNNWVNEQKNYPESKLKLNIYCVADSIIVKEGRISSGKKRETIKIKRKCLNSDGKIVHSMSTYYYFEGTNMTRLEFIKKMKRQAQINMVGSYINALEKVSEESEFISSYLENIKLTADSIPPYAMANYILKNDIDINDYFVRIIIFINMIYR